MNHTLVLQLERPLLALLALNIVLYLWYINRYHLVNEPFILHFIDFVQAGVPGFFIYGLYGAFAPVLRRLLAERMGHDRPETDQKQMKPLYPFWKPTIPFGRWRTLRQGPDQRLHNEATQFPEDAAEANTIWILGSGKIIVTFHRPLGNWAHTSPYDRLQICHPLHDSDMDCKQWSKDELFRLQEEIRRYSMRQLNSRETA